MVATDVCPEPGAIARWSETLDVLHEHIAHRFARVEVRERVRRYLVGLLDRIERKNGWQLAEAIGECGAKGVQRLLNAATWNADAVRAGCPQGGCATMSSTISATRRAVC